MFIQMKRNTTVASTIILNVPTRRNFAKKKVVSFWTNI